jgi:hypothetical protein
MNTWQFPAISSCQVLTKHPQADAGTKRVASSSPRTPAKRKASAASSGSGVSRVWVCGLYSWVEAPATVLQPRVLSAVETLPTTGEGQRVAQGSTDEHVMAVFDAWSNEVIEVEIADAQQLSKNKQRLMAELQVVLTRGKL